MNKRQFRTGHGETKHISAWARDPRCTVSRTAFVVNLRNGLPVEQALTYRQSIAGRPRRNLPPEPYKGPIRMGDTFQVSHVKCFVWDIHKGIIELRSYGGVADDSCNPVLEFLTEDKLRRCRLVEDNPAGELICGKI